MNHFMVSLYYLEKDWNYSKESRIIFSLVRLLEEIRSVSALSSEIWLLSWPIFAYASCNFDIKSYW